MIYNIYYITLFIYFIYTHKKLATQFCSLRNLMIYLPETQESWW